MVWGAAIRWAVLQMLRRACKASVFAAAGPDGVGGRSTLVAHRDMAAMRHPPRNTGPFTLLVFINPPAAMARSLWLKCVDNPWDEILLVASIGVLWYWVGLNVNSWQKRRTLLMFTSVPLRVVTDLALMAFSSYFLWFFRNFDVAHLPWQWRTPELALVLCWLVGPPFIFGRDLIQPPQSVAASEPHPEELRSTSDAEAVKGRSEISIWASWTVSRFLFPEGQQSFLWARYYYQALATYPGVERSGPLLLPYLVLLRMGFALPERITPPAVRSYRTFSPLPEIQAVKPSFQAVYFLWHFP